ncbi:hypothetical protein TUM18999_10060 [Pseudomonas tohonis]|uniref:Uncharacterized protein n=1 Tax=Pseudomonas tohonis TaxID=2725477 RepID=A0A6J4E0C7_9PSED|nr:hypothetical protein TUM18999_10060 [Pseudomonas tohonis]GJN55906.1 hypothetical protein TUM20286_56580 [Pseudomonas tohonis]
MALTALYFIGKEGLSANVVPKIVSAQIGEELMKLRACKIREWMRSALRFAAKEIE